MNGVGVMASLLVRNKELAAMLGCRVDTLCKKVRGGDYLQPIRKERNHPRWNRREVDAWIADGMPCAAEWDRRKDRHLKGEYVTRILAGREKVERELAGV